MKETEKELKKPTGIVLLIFIMGIFAFFFLLLGILMMLAGGYGFEAQWGASIFWHGLTNFLMGVGFVFAILGFGRRSGWAYFLAICLYLAIILQYIFTGIFNFTTFFEMSSVGLVIVCVLILVYLSSANIRGYFRVSTNIQRKRSHR
ncbi:MAG: hypothetical protein QXN63_03620 [Candidatus Bathyarchaeia archaeon]